MLSQIPFVSVERIMVCSENIVRANVCCCIYKMSENVESLTLKKQFLVLV